MVFILVAFKIIFCAPPTGAEAKNFIQYYYHGNSPILADVKICQEIQNNQCINAADPQKLNANQKYMLWMVFMVPISAGEQQISITLNHQKTEIWEKKFKIRSSIRYRTWKSVKANKAGDWSVDFFHQTNGQSIKLHTLHCKVE